MYMDRKIKHLEMIEAIAERMAKNSFTIKGWTMGLVSIVGALASQNSDKRFLLILLLPTIVFWGLDTYYLLLERKYRFLYKKVSKLDEKDIDFNMDYNLISVDGLDAKKICFFNCLLSPTEIYFYLPIILGILFILKIVGVF